MNAPLDLAGHKYGRLTVIKRVENHVLPSHNHHSNGWVVFDKGSWSNNASAAQPYCTNSSTTPYDAGNRTWSSTGGSAAHNNMPPYLVVYMWKRTS